MVEARSHVAWTGGTRETNYQKSVDNAILRMVNEPPGRNKSERKVASKVDKSGGRAPRRRVKAARTDKTGKVCPLRRGVSDSMVARTCKATGETLPAPGRNSWRTEGPITINGKWTRRREGGGRARSSNEGGQCLRSKGALLPATPLTTREAGVR